MKKLPLFPKDQTVWIEALFIICTIATWLSSLFLTPVPGAYELSRNLLWEERLFGEALYSIELLSCAFIFILSITLLIKMKSVKKSVTYAIMGLLGLTIKSGLTLGLGGESDEQMGLNMSQQMLLFYYVSNCAVVPFLFLYLKPPFTPEKGVLNRAVITLLTSFILWVAIMLTHTVIDYSIVLVPFRFIPIWVPFLALLPLFYLKQKTHEQT